MRAVFLAFLWQAAGAILALGLAGGAIMTAASLADGGWPSAETLRITVVPFAAYGALAWTIARWRQSGEDIAIANAGVPPWHVAAIGALLCSACLLGAATPTAAAADWTLETTAYSLVAHTPRGAVAVRWTDGARWDGVGEHPTLPRPVPGPAVEARSSQAPIGARLAVMLVLLIVLIRVPTPGVALTLTVTVAAFASAHALAVMVG